MASQGRGRPRKTFSMEEIGQKVMTELNRRLERPIDAAEIPGTQLMQIAQRYMAYLEEIEKQAKASQEDEVQLTPLQIADKPGLPLQRRFDILEAYYQEVCDVHWELSERLKEMHAELKGEVYVGDDT